MITTMFGLPFASNFWMPRNASTVASSVDNLFYFILSLSTFFFVVIIAATVYFVLKYRQRSENDKTSPLSHHIGLEIIWSAIPGVLLLSIFAWGFVSWINISTVPGDAMEVRVNAARWSWSFSYPRHGVNGSPELIVPADQNIKLVMISSDVLHSFYVPEFRVKRDVLPSRYSVLWFNTPSKALTRLKNVDPKELQLGNVVLKIGFAASRGSADSLVREGHILVNGKKETNSSLQLKLHDTVEVEVDDRLKKTLLDLEKAHKKSLKKAEDDDARDKLKKQYKAQYQKIAPLWLRSVLSSMRAASDVMDSFRNNTIDMDGIKKMRPEWIYADLNGLRSMYGFVSDSFNMLCTEYCGKEHSKMITRVRVVSRELFGQWLKRTLSKGATGPELLNRYGCTSCHSVKDDSRKVGPSLKGIYGKKRVVIDSSSGKQRTLVLKGEAFKQYVRESILMPQAKVVLTYEGQKMPTFKGRIKQEEIDVLIDYLEGLR